MILCVIASATSVLPIIQEHQPNSGLLQSSFVSLYIIYLTWSAMANTPNPNCKLDLAEKVENIKQIPSFKQKSFTFCLRSLGPLTTQQLL